MKSIEFTTAQNVKIEYEIASTGSRIVATIIDLFLFFIYFMIMSISLDQTFLSSGIGTGKFAFLLLIRIPWIFYSPIVEFLTKGQSLGKYVMGIRVVKMSGENATIREYATRWIFRVVDIWFGFGFLAILFASTSEKGQRLGDMMANTVLIKKSNSSRYNLKDILALKNSETHEVLYPQVERFTDEDMMLIKETIQRVELYPTEETKKFAIELAEKSALLIGLNETPSKRLEFLRRILLDYVVLTR
jgi:uncharacterized RDD family membrane protein YckC